MENGERVGSCLLCYLSASFFPQTCLRCVARAVILFLWRSLINKYVVASIIWMSIRSSMALAMHGSSSVG